MAVTAGELTDTLLRRVRDITGQAHARDFARARLSDAQRLVNAALGVVTDSTTLSTIPTQMLYDLVGPIPNAVRVLAVREGTRDLAKLRDVQQLRHLSIQWFRELGSRFEAWTQVGRDLLIVSPAKTVAGSVTVISAKLTTVLGGEGDLMDLPDEYEDLVVTVGEIMLLLRQRDLAACEAAMQRLSTMIPLEMPAGAARFHVQGGGVESSRATVRQGAR